MTASAEVLGAGRTLRVGSADPAEDDAGAEVIDVAAIWLRDACVCSACRRPATYERLIDSTSIDPGIGVVTASAEGAVLRGRTSDGHDVVVPVDRIRSLRHAVDHHPVHHRRPAGSVPPPNVAAAAELRRIALPALHDDPGEVLDVLAQDGALVLGGVDPSDDGLRAIAERIAPIHPTNYGTTWSIDAVVDAVSEVESTHALLVHTDLPYRTDPPGVQLLLACRTDVPGGASTLVDGAAAAERLRAEDPESFELLATVPVEFPYRRDDVEIVGWSPLIELAHDGSVRVIRRAPDLVGSPCVSAPSAGPWFAALRRWSALLDDPANTIVVPLDVGEMLIFDNHRMLHGRTAFDLDAHGRRILRGCYLHRDDVASRRTVLRRRR